MPEHNQRQLSKREKKLKEENQALRSEVHELKAQISRLADKIEEGKWPPAAPEGFLSPEKMKSVQYLSDEYDDLMVAKSQTRDELRLVSTRLEAIEKKCQEITAAIETFEDYSYKNNLKIVGVPVPAERETAEQTALLCLRLFSALGVEDISILDIDTAHRVPARRASNKPNAIICKFTRRLAKDKVMDARRRVSSLRANDLGFEEDVLVENLALFDHLSPRLQTLLFEARKFKNEKDFKFCWARGGFVFLRKTESSVAIKLARIDDLHELVHDGMEGASSRG